MPSPSPIDRLRSTHGSAGTHKWVDRGRFAQIGGSRQCICGVHAILSLAEDLTEAWSQSDTPGAARLRDHFEAAGGLVDLAVIREVATLLGGREGLHRLEQLDRTLRKTAGASDARRCVLEAMLDVATPGQLPAVYRRAVSTRDMDVAEAAAKRIEAPTTAEAAIASADWLMYEGESAAAAGLYEAALATEPDNSRALLGLAAVCLDREDSGRAVELAAEAARHVLKPARATLPPFIKAASRLWTERRPISTVDTLFFCHPTRKLTRNVSLGPPGVGLLSKAVDSWRKHLRPTGRAVVMYDHRIGEEGFRDNLVHFCRDEGLELVVNTSNGLRKQWLAAFAATMGDAALVIEQDHEFLPSCPSVQQLIDLFNARPDISYLRLNRRNNIKLRFDLALEQGRRDRESGLVRTSKFSNTPHLLRRDYFNAIVLPIISDVTRWDGKNSGAAGVEEAINNFLFRAEAVLGLPAVMRLAGTAIWGHPGAARVAVHTGV